MARILHLVKYAAASAVSLAIDYGSYLAIAASGLCSIPVAATCGYAVGLLFAYAVMTRTVFTSRFARHGRRKEFLLFMASGLLGLALTFGTSSIVMATLGPEYGLPKLCAIAVSFWGVYWFRCVVVFCNRNSQGFGAFAERPCGGLNGGRQEV
jgi:putative flippase GtrA